jgi:hypothetical protein
MNISTVGVTFFNECAGRSDAITYGLSGRRGTVGVVIFYTLILLNIRTAWGAAGIFPLFSMGYRIFGGGRLLWHGYSI